MEISITNFEDKCDESTGFKWETTYDLRIQDSETDLDLDWDGAIEIVQTGKEGETYLFHFIVNETPDGVELDSMIDFAFEMESIEREIQDNHRTAYLSLLFDGNPDSSDKIKYTTGVVDENQVQLF